MSAPLSNYEKKLASGEIHADPQQREVIKELDRIYDELVERQKRRDSRLGKVRRRIKPRPPIHGLYMVGSVGVGKTLMMDLFYECLPVRKMRLHFHAFMQRIHQLLRESQGIKNPLESIARQISNDVLVICFDEFFVSNIADAMILGELFKALFAGGVCLVTTSNTAPDDLYKHGIQREQFIPAIEEIKRHVRVIALTTQQDYRYEHEKSISAYFSPLNERSNESMENAFQHIAQSESSSDAPIDVLGRKIDIIKQANHVIWFQFHKLCGRPRSQEDYLELVKDYNVFLISDIPKLDTVNIDLIISFMNLIDVLYDAQKRLVVSADTTIELLYTKNDPRASFARTRSRLVDMQSKEYIEKCNQ